MEFTVAMSRATVPAVTDGASPGRARRGDSGERPGRRHVGAARAAPTAARRGDIAGGMHRSLGHLAGDDRDVLAVERHRRGGAHPPCQVGGTTGRLFEAGERQLAVGHRGDHRRADPAGDLLVVVALGKVRVADAQHVASGTQRCHRASSPADAARDRAHVERIAEHHPVEAQVGAQCASTRGSASPAGRRSRGPRCALINDFTPASITAPNGARWSQELLTRPRHRGQPEVRVDGGVAMTGEVLGACGDALRLHPSTNATPWRATTPGRCRRRAHRSPGCVVQLTSTSGASTTSQPAAAPAPDRCGDCGRRSDVVVDAQRRGSGVDEPAQSRDGDGATLPSTVTTAAGLAAARRPSRPPPQ